jgi:hypothetical protein
MNSKSLLETWVNYISNKKGIYKKEVLESLNNTQMVTLYNDGNDRLYTINRYLVEKLNHNNIYAIQIPKSYFDRYNKNGNVIVPQSLSDESILVYEDTSAVGGAAGMGSVVSAAPSSLPGTTIGANWSGGGGTEGSGDIGVPYNPSGGKMMFQKFPMGKFHGAMTGKKKRSETKKVFKPKTNKHTKVMSFDDYTKDTINRVKY